MALCGSGLHPEGRVAARMAQKRPASDETAPASAEEHPLFCLLHVLNDTVAQRQSLMAAINDLQECLHAAAELQERLLKAHMYASFASANPHMPSQDDPAGQTFAALRRYGQERCAYSLPLTRSRAHAGGSA